MAKTREQLKADKARSLLASGRVKCVSENVWEVEGNGGTYEVRWGEHRVESCSCPAGKTWMRKRLHQAGKHVCYHVTAVAMLRKGV